MPLPYLTLHHVTAFLRTTTISIAVLAGAVAATASRPNIILFLPEYLAWAAAQSGKSK